MQQVKPSEELQTALRASQKAEEIVLRYFGPEVASTLKPDQTPVTAADLEAEQAIIATLRERFPDYGFIAEESGRSPNSSEMAWIIDPIDGTKNFARGIPLFGTQIALARRGTPILGVSRLPAMQETLCAELGGGAQLNGRRVQVSTVAKLSQAHVSFGGLNHFCAAGLEQGLLDIVRTAARVRAFGDAYAYHLVASGRCEAVIEAKIAFWDVAALSAIVQEAGGVCSDFSGHPIGVDTTNIVCANGAAIHAELLDAINRAANPGGGRGHG